MGKNKSIADSILQAARDGDLQEVERYIVGKKNVNVQGADGRTPLINASANHHSGVVRLLLNAGADVKVFTNSQKSALNYALCAAFSYNVGGKRGDASAHETVKYLLERGCPVSKFDIAFAMLLQDLDVVKMLTEKVAKNKKLLREACEYAIAEAFEFDAEGPHFEKKLAFVRTLC